MACALYLSTLLALRFTQGRERREENPRNRENQKHTEGERERKREEEGEEGGAMVGKDTSKSEEQSPPTQPQAESIETNGGVLAVKEETAEEVMSKSERDPESQNDVPKKRGAFHLVRVALFMVRRGSDKKTKSVHVEGASKNLLRRVGSMRPLHLHDGYKPQPALTSPPSAQTTGNCYLMQPSPSSSPSSTASSSTKSRSLYASAPNLQELGRKAGCNSDDDIDQIDEFIDNGDEMIDVKAEEFIANFYKQMRLQHN